MDVYWIEELYRLCILPRWLTVNHGSRLLTLWSSSDLQSSRECLNPRSSYVLKTKAKSTKDSNIDDV